jgi:hypothetical protein
MAAIGLAIALGAARSRAGTTSAAPPECTASPARRARPGDARLNRSALRRPVIDSELDLTTPVAHHRISGHFEGTAIKFTIYLPPAVQWKGRFFQYTYPLSDENALDRVVAFGPPAEG